MPEQRASWRTLENRAEDQFDQLILCFSARKCATYLVQHQDKLEIILIILIVVLFIIMAASPAVLSPAARLPVELVEMICNELAALGSTVYRAGSSRWQQDTWHGHLAAAALISRRWAGPAQTALLRSLFLDSPDECADFLAAMEDHPHLLGLPRSLHFEITNCSVQACEPYLGVPDFVPILFARCHNVEFVHIYAELDIGSEGFDDAFSSMRRLRTFIFESNPTGGESNAWFQTSVRRAPPSLRTLAVQYDVNIEIIFDTPASVELLEYHYMGNYPLLLLYDLDDILDDDPRPIKMAKFALWLEPDLDRDGKPIPQVSRDRIEHFEAKFAARGVVFQLLELEWNVH